MEVVDRLDHLRTTYQRKGRGAVSVETIQNLGFLEILDELAPEIIEWWRARINSITASSLEFSASESQAALDLEATAFRDLHEKAKRVLGIF
jgi:hypothetical protein